MPDKKIIREMFPVECPDCLENNDMDESPYDEVICEHCYETFKLGAILK